MVMHTEGDIMVNQSVRLTNAGSAVYTNGHIVLVFDGQVAVSFSLFSGSSALQNLKGNPFSVALNTR